MRKKITVNYKGYKINGVSAWYYKNSDHTSITVAGTAKILRELLKIMKSKGIINCKKLWVKSETYSMGDNISVFLYKPVGDTISTVKRIVEAFEHGSFDGMEDIYRLKTESERPVITLENGKVVDFGMKYGHVLDRPPYDTKEYNMEVNNDNL